MTRCFFNFRQGSSYFMDHEGIEFDTVEEAYLEAVRAAKDIWSELLNRREDPLLCLFDVRDAKGNELFCLPFAEILESCAGRTPEHKLPALQDSVAHSLESRRLAKQATTGISAALKETRAALGETFRLMSRIDKANEE